MEMAAAAETSSDRALTDLLRRRGQRVTTQRLVLYRLLRERDRHVSAEELTEAARRDLPGTSAPTVYATLALFEDLGLVRRVPVGGGAALYDPRPEPHHHAVCRRCGAVEDLEAPAELAGALSAAARGGFAPERADLVVSGLCARCQATGSALAPTATATATGAQGAADTPRPGLAGPAAMR
jgi:Fur family ferric uptake transcriptional regulator/Fur family peroxide stress response transcriptional regulator